MTFKCNLDKYTNKYIPSSVFKNLHPHAARWFGHHDPKYDTEDLPDYLLWIDTFIGSFCSVIVIEAVFMHSEVFKQHHTPSILASYGATSILVFNATPAPLSQPRNVFVGHVFSALLGLCLQKLFGLSQGGRDNYWVGGGLSVGLSSVLMSITNCVHPPAGASAILPFIEEDVRQMSWWYIPVQIISSLLTIAVGLVTNNILRRYPTHWWVATTPFVQDPPPEAHEVTTYSTALTRHAPKQRNILKINTDHVQISKESIEIPQEISVTTEEYEALKSIQNKIAGITSLENIDDKSIDV